MKEQILNIEKRKNDYFDYLIEINIPYIYYHKSIITRKKERINSCYLPLLSKEDIEKLRERYVYSCSDGYYTFKRYCNTFYIWRDEKLILKIDCDLNKFFAAFTKIPFIKTTFNISSFELKNEIAENFSWTQIYKSNFFQAKSQMKDIITDLEKKDILILKEKLTERIKDECNIFPDMKYSFYFSPGKNKFNGGIIFHRGYGYSIHT